MLRRQEWGKMVLFNFIRWKKGEREGVRNHSMGGEGCRLPDVGSGERAGSISRRDPGSRGVVPDSINETGELAHLSVLVVHFLVFCRRVRSCCSIH